MKQFFLAIIACFIFAACDTNNAVVQSAPATPANTEKPKKQLPERRAPTAEDLDPSNQLPAYKNLPPHKRPMEHAPLVPDTMPHP